MADFLRTRHGGSLLAIILLCLLFFAADRIGQALLTPLPRSWLIGTLVVGVPIGCFLAFAATSPIPVRPLRRVLLYLTLALLGTGFATLGKMLYLFTVFGAPLSPSIEAWPIVGSETSAIKVYSASLDQEISIDARPDTIRLAAFGKCLPVAVERNAQGDTRLAAEQPVLGPDSLQTCDLASFLNEARARKNRDAS